MLMRVNCERNHNLESSALPLSYNSHQKPPLLLPLCSLLWLIVDSLRIVPVCRLLMRVNYERSHSWESDGQNYN